MQVYRLETKDNATSPKNLYYERIQGYVHRFAHNSGWGFLRAEPFEGDLFFHIDNLMAPFKDKRLTSGQVVEFTIAPDDRNRPHAVFVKPVVHKTPYHLIGQGRLSGFIRKFQIQGVDSVGIINSPFFDGDLMCPQSNCLPAQVSFAFGQPCTFDISGWDENGECVCVAQWMTTKVPCEPEDWVGQGRITGQLKSFQDRWGFINSDKFQGDLFVHRDGICDRYGPRRLTPGTVVEFEVGLDDVSRGGRLLGINVVTCEMLMTPLESMVEYSNEILARDTMPSMSLCMPPSGLKPKPRISTVHLSSLIDPPLSTVTSQSVADCSLQYSSDATRGRRGADLGANRDERQPDSSPDSVQSSAQRSHSMHPITPIRPSFSTSLFTTPVCGGFGSRHALFPAYGGEKLTEIRREIDELCDGKDTHDGGETTSVTTVGEDDSCQSVTHTLSLAMDSWEPNPSDHDNPQSPTGQPTTLKLLKGDLLKLLHDSTTGWAYVTRWDPSESVANARGWVPKTLLKEIHVCRVQNDWDDSVQYIDGPRSTMSIRWGEWVATEVPDAGCDWIYGNKVGENSCKIDSQCGWIPRTLIKLA